jgi:hypothetical protein
MANRKSTAPPQADSSKVTNRQRTSNAGRVVQRYEDSPTLSTLRELLSQQVALFPKGLTRISTSVSQEGMSLTLEGPAHSILPFSEPSPDSENYAPPTPTNVLGAPAPALSRAEAVELQLAPGAIPALSGIAGVWSGACRDCGGAQPVSCCKGLQKFDNNCAHFLSDALIRCGFSELLTDTSFYRCDKGNCRCPTERRPIRAREMWDWFKRKATSKLEKVRWDEIPKNSGWWAIFQLDASVYWGGHVIVLDTKAWEYYGTCSYPAWDQYAYQW